MIHLFDKTIPRSEKTRSRDSAHLPMKTKIITYFRAIYLFINKVEFSFILSEKQPSNSLMFKKKFLDDTFLIKLNQFETQAKLRFAPLAIQNTKAAKSKKTQKLRPRSIDKSRFETTSRVNKMGN